MCKFFSTKSNLFFQLSISGSQKGIRVSPNDKTEKSQSLHFFYSFQNGSPVERNVAGTGLHVQNRLQGCTFFSPTIPKV